MNTKGLSKQAAALAAELKMKYSRIDVVRELFNEIAGAVGKRRLKSDVMHATGLMEKIVKLAHM